MTFDVGRGSVVAVLPVALVGGLGAFHGVALAVPGGASGVRGIAAMVAGTIVLFASVELLVRAMVRTALQFRVSVFLLSVVFSGFEFDNVAFGVLNGFREFRAVSFGLAVGNAISIFGIVLAIGAITYPFDVDVPRDYLALTAVAPLVLLPFAVLGSFTPVAGVLLLALGIGVFGYVYHRERRADRAFMQADEVREMRTVADGEASAPKWAASIPARFRRHAWFWPALLVLAVLGVVAGAELSTSGVEAIMGTWDLSGTILGATLVTVLYTLDDLLLVIEPLRHGYPDVAVGGVLGSLLFFVTANVGIVALVGTVRVGPGTMFLHLPALVVVTWIGAYFLSRGRLRRPHGAVLLGLYLGYLAGNAIALSTLPVGG